jgi:hypothetical protein
MSIFVAGAEVGTNELSNTPRMVTLVDVFRCVCIAIISQRRLPVSRRGLFDCRQMIDR